MIFFDHLQQKTDHLHHIACNVVFPVIVYMQKIMGVRGQIFILTHIHEGIL